MVAVRPPLAVGVHSIAPLESRYVTVAPMPGVEVGAGAAKVEEMQRLPAARMVKTDECMIVLMTELSTNRDVEMFGVEKLRIGNMPEGDNFAEVSLISV